MSTLFPVVSSLSDPVDHASPHTILSIPSLPRAADPARATAGSFRQTVKERPALAHALCKHRLWHYRTTFCVHLNSARGTGSVLGRRMKWCGHKPCRARSSHARPMPTPSNVSVAMQDLLLFHWQFNFPLCYTMVKQKRSPSSAPSISSRISAASLLLLSDFDLFAIFSECRKA